MLFIVVQQLWVDAGRFAVGEQDEIVGVLLGESWVQASEGEGGDEVDLGLGVPPWSWSFSGLPLPSRSLLDGCQAVRDCLGC